MTSDHDEELEQVYALGTRLAADLAVALAAIHDVARSHIGTDLDGVVCDAVDDVLADELAALGVRVYPELDGALGAVLSELGSPDDAAAAALDDLLDDDEHT